MLRRCNHAHVRCTDDSETVGPAAVFLAMVVGRGGARWVGRSEGGRARPIASATRICDFAISIYRQRTRHPTAHALFRSGALRPESVQQPAARRATRAYE